MTRPQHHVVVFLMCGAAAFVPFPEAYRWWHSILRMFAYMVIFSAGRLAERWHL